MKTIIYDIEIKRAVPGKTEERDPKVEYCEGWHDHANMGISVIGCYDYNTERYRVFCEDNQQQFIDLVRDSDLCVGFNSIPFDNAVIGLTQDWGTMPEDRCYDLLREVWAAAGLPAEFSPKTHGGFGLDRMCSVNFGTHKTGNGATAPALWQRGRIGEVIDYCLNDVYLTKQLFDRVRLGDALVCPKTNAPLELRRP